MITNMITNMITKITDTLIYYYLIIKTFIVNWYIYLKSKIITIKQVHISGPNGIESIFYRYLYINIIDYFIELLSRLKNYADLNFTRIQIINENESGENTFILDANINFKREVISLSDINKYLDSINKENPSMSNNRIFIKFELEHPNGSLCLKDYSIKYRDIEKFYGHTLQNIMDFNKINIDEKTSNVHIVFFKNGKRTVHILPYAECKDMHITDFYDL